MPYKIFGKHSPLFEEFHVKFSIKEDNRLYLSFLMIHLLSVFSGYSSDTIRQILGMDSFFPPREDMDDFFKKKVGSFQRSREIRKTIFAYRDPFGKIYQDLLTKKDRLVLGEFYTPDYLSDYFLKRSLSFYEKGEDKIPFIMDPSCGCGSFLLSAARRWMQKKIPCDTILSHLAGIDLNPLAVLMCRAHLLIALSGKRSYKLDIPDFFFRKGSSDLFKINCFDSLLSDCAEKKQFHHRCDILLGNPPWITWDQLSEKYRNQISFLWEKYHLFSLSGKDALYGGGKKDISSLMICAGMDYFLKKNGILGSIIPLSLLKTRGAGEGFRLFLSGKNGVPCTLLEVDDLSGLSPFENVGNRTGGIVVRKKDGKTSMIPYLIWKEKNKGIQTDLFRLKTDGIPGAPFSPLLEKKLIPKKEGVHSYHAQLGANTAGANGVYWIELSNTSPDPKSDLIAIRNLPHLGKRVVPFVEMVVEKDLVYPLLRWKDVDAFSAKPSGHIIIPQDPDQRCGIDEKTMKTRYPLSFAFFSHFERILRERAAWRKFQSGFPYWSMYNIDRNTFSPFKVVWRRMDTRIRAAVLLNKNQDKPIIPQETLSMIAVGSLEEADYLAALLNSPPIQKQVASFSLSGSKGFGSPGILSDLDISPFDPQNPDHLHLARFGRSMREKLS